jgi:hypothetical protein
MEAGADTRDLKPVQHACELPGIVQGDDPVEALHPIHGPLCSQATRLLWAGSLSLLTPMW